MIQRRPILCATAPVVPEPAKESRTQSPGLVAISRTLFISRSGFGVPKLTSAPNSSFASVLDSPVWPTSSWGHHVQGTTPFDLLRNSLRRGTPFPSRPKYARLSATSLLYSDWMIFQQFPGG